ncbi:hypothetical protein ABH926_005402 [Catenulispora sp. GP43]|uniref:hypothetical protein n=1 Tax=Catenulispora sp. GP43 TaxID=3156263 RepID=UPI003516D243
MSDRDKNAEILSLRHQLAVLQRQQGSNRARFAPEDRAFLAAPRRLAEGAGQTSACSSRPWPLATAGPQDHFGWMRSLAFRAAELAQTTDDPPHDTEQER